MSALPPTPQPAAEPPAVPAPAIDMAYWFAYSKTLVDGAVKQRDDAAERLQNLVTWLWTIYTAGVTVGVTLGKASLAEWQAVLLGIPSIMLPLVYCMTLWVRGPNLVTFDPRSPSDIEGVYDKAVQSKTKRLRLTVFVAYVTTVVVGVAIIGSSLATATHDAASLTVTSAALDGTPLIDMSATLPDVPKAILVVERKERAWSCMLPLDPVRERLHELISVPPDGGAFRVRLSAEDETLALSRDVSVVGTERASSVRQETKEAEPAQPDVRVGVHPRCNSVSPKAS